MEITLEKIELVKDRTGVSYKEAKDALEAADGSVVDAIISIEEVIDTETSKSVQDQGAAVVPGIPVLLFGAQNEIVRFFLTADAQHRGDEQLQGCLEMQRAFGVRIGFAQHVVLRVHACHAGLAGFPPAGSYGGLCDPRTQRFTACHSPE